jgi:DNA-binding PadR family transcriptional regulator
MTELETLALGVVWLRGPCTAYVVKSALGASGGAIYPLLRRLEAEGLIRSRAQTWGTRGKKELSITPRGIEALQRSKGELDEALAELDARRKLLNQISRRLAPAPPRRRRAASGG